MRSIPPGRYRGYQGGDLLTIGELNDMYTEMQRDEQAEEFCYVGSQADFDSF